ncbi:MAG: hypothetical protein KGZ30_02180 [Anaplasmataceae bacterium]|nr:hypothetical protein [Anaplasmataceae bacterium]
MLKNFVVFQLAASMICFSLYPAQLLIPHSDISTSTPEEVREHFRSVKEGIEHRWNLFQSGRAFKPFELGKSNDALKDEFKEIRKTRELTWTTLGYEVGKHLIRNDLVRAPGCVAFDFNNTTPNYNASTMCFGNKHYLACEGPRAKDLSNFFSLLTTHRVTHLVRLTDSYEGEEKKCHPYWEGLLTESPDGTSYLNIPAETGSYTIHAFDMAYWKDNQGVNPNQLLALVLEVREALRKDPSSLLVVHCSAGVGRTGTFLASLEIVDAIDRGDAFSIEEIVYRLSLQRTRCVAKLGQYITLHRLAEAYLTQASS